MTANLDKFSRDLNKMLDGHTIATSDPALQTATVLLSLDLDAESKPPADLRARWVARVQQTTERKSFTQTLRTRPVLAMLLALLILFTLSGVVYAIGRSLGYIPGIGLVDQSAPLRILAEPSILDRDGITVKVEEAILSADKTVIKFSIDGISYYDHPQDLTKCDDSSSGISLPDETHLKIIAGYALNGWSSGYEARYTFDPLPANVNDVTFIPPCFQAYLPNAKLEDWKLTLHFIPAPPQMTVVPVIEVTPADQNPLILEKVIETDSGYILAGTFNSPGLPTDAKVAQFGQPPRITDASGQDVPFTFANYKLDLPAEKTQAGVFPWAFELHGKQFNFPLTITVNSVAVEYLTPQAQFEFDAGPQSTNGQVWENLNIHFELAGHPVHVLNVIRTVDGYQFNFVSDDKIIFNSVQLSIGDSVQGMTGMNGLDSFGSVVKFAGTVPNGKMTVLLSHPVILESGNWQLQWKPDIAPTLPTPTAISQAAPQTCLTVDSWTAALANPQPIPVDLPGKVFLQNLGDPNSSIYVSNPDGSNKQEIGRGWDFQPVSTSPDGSQVLFSQGDGLYIEPIATKEMRRVPETIPGDVLALWSPDGMRIAFLRADSQTSYPNIYIINPDGTGTQKITEQVGDYYLLSWLPDGSALFFTELTRAGYTLKKLELASGTITEFFAPKGGHIDAITPDGNEVVFEELIDEATTGLYISDLDGSNRRLIASASILVPGSWGFSQAKWSPDGKWLAIAIYTTTANGAQTSTVLVNPATCQIVPLPYTDNLLAWAR